jgi:hypothetical protein
VALVVRENTHVIRLMHRDAGLSLDIEAFESLATAEDYRDRLAGFLDLPPVTAAGTPLPEKDDLASGPARTRRKRATGLRRPRFLSRRRAGDTGSTSIVHGREIIARN